MSHAAYITVARECGLTATIGVGSTALLGCRFVIDILAIIYCVYVLMGLTKTLRELKDDLDDINDAKENQNDGQTNKPSGKPDERVGLSLQDQSRLKLLVGNLQKLIKAFFNACRICSAIFHKKMRKPPNEKS